MTRKAADHRASEGSPEAEGQDHDAMEEAEEAVVPPAPVVVPDDAEYVPLAGFPRGRNPGTFLHKCLELYDFAQVDAPQVLTDLLR